MPARLALCLLAALLLGGCASSSTTAPPRLGPDRSLAENVRASGTLTTLAAALDEAGLSETLAGPGPYTLFAPTDAAFAALPEREARLLESDGPEPYNLLAYHLVPVRLGPEAFDGRSVRTVNGAALVLARDSGLAVEGLTVEHRPVVGELPARNGVLYLIGAVLIPPGAQD